MLEIDNRKYDGNEFRLLFDRMGQAEPYRNPEGKRYALCLKNAFELLGAVIYLRDRGGSALLIHADTPLETAGELARNGDCSYLLYGNLETVIVVSVSTVPYEPSVLQYSSGTTGVPKLIARSWKRVDDEVEHYNRLFGETPYEQPIILVPVSHSFGLITGTLASWARGVQPTIVQDKNPKFALHTIRTAKDPIVYAAPFLYHVLDTLGKEEFRCHKVVISGSPPSEALLTRMKAQTDEVWQQYGCTEVGCISVGKHPSANTDVGKPLGHLTVSIRSDDREVERQGEIRVSIVGSDVIGSKDLGYLDPETDRLHVLGRLDDLINVSGLKVIPSEVEAVIGSMPGVSETVVVKTAHKVWGEAVRALVVAASSIGEQDVRSWCVRRLPAYKVPSVIELVSEIPKLPSGKVSRKLLQEKERS
ncbi:AMP-binding protein [Cohnella mopanensis]|uniref:AMP-binding protein n=1 Tax=Cohnella mopanensis TaxID=2911966 RepID=UPI001EF8E592|nr:AMP-binding protein [Cohnella mopanensis]